MSVTIDTAPLAPVQPAPASAAGGVRRTMRLLFGLLGGLVLTALVGIAAVAIAVPALLGATPLAVLTSSMEPTYPPGTLVVVKPTPADQIRVGDVITFQLHSGQPEVVTHRVTEVAVDAEGEHVFRTQGDNNPQPDPQSVREVQLKGKLLYAVPVVGYAQNALAGETRAILVPVIAGGLFLYAAVNVILAIVGRRRARAATASKEAS